MASDEHLRCPHCRAKLLNALRGSVVVWCRRCKRNVTLSNAEQSTAA
jgi:DNA-directed RNA polymerase subunit RPC12/RpoP